MCEITLTVSARRFDFVETDAAVVDTDHGVSSSTACAACDTGAVCGIYTVPFQFSSVLCMH